MKHLIPYIEAAQKRFNFEGAYFIGIELDRFVHFFIAMGLFLGFLYFKRKKIGLVIVLILVLLKEVIDLTVVYYYEPIKLKFWIDSFMDILMGLLGLFFGYMLFCLYNRYRLISRKN